MVANVAVCVCTRSRPQMARRCLASLCRQDIDRKLLRVTLILVDNNPEPAARPIYDALCAEQGPAGYVHCPQPGIPVARNAAIDAALCAGAQYIAFLDDDEVAPPHWLRCLLQVLEATGADAVQGGVRGVPAEEVEVALKEARPPVGKLASAECESLATCNVLFRASLVQPPLALRFDESMCFTGGSDREFFMRARKSGARLLRIDGVDVIEEVCEGRDCLRYRATRAFAAGSNYFERMTRNEPAPVAALRIGLRAAERSVSGVVKLAWAAALLLLVRPRAAGEQWHKACASLCFAAGCVTPVAGVRAYPYRNVQGA